jgi:hypothetical protein
MVLATSVAFAQGTPRMEQREANQAARIGQGSASGALTPAEAARLEAGQARVDRMQGRAAADGRMTVRERARIDQVQDVQSARIHRQKHDRQRDLDGDGRMDRRPRRN